MKALAIEVDESGALRVAPELRRRGLSRLTLLVAEPAGLSISGEVMRRIAEEGGAFDVLAAEPDLYSDADIEPGHENPYFGQALSN